MQAKKSFQSIVVQETKLAKTSIQKLQIVNAKSECFQNMEGKKEPIQQDRMNIFKDRTYCTDDWRNIYKKPRIKEKYKVYGQKSTYLFLKFILAKSFDISSTLAQVALIWRRAKNLWHNFTFNRLYYCPHPINASKQPMGYKFFKFIQFSSNPLDVPTEEELRGSNKKIS